MKILNPAKAIDVKRAFLQTFFLRKAGVAGAHQVTPPTKKQYLSALKKAKRALLKLKEPALNRLVGGHTKRRLRAYTEARWFVGTVSPQEVGVWKGAGGLPIGWTRGSLRETASKVRMGLLKKDSRISKRAARAIPAIIGLKKVLKKDALSLPIVFESGYGTPARKGLPKMKGDLDDGNMRAIAYVVSGDKQIKAYIGKSPR